jgi:hypothetical protein
MAMLCQGSLPVQQQWLFNVSLELSEVDDLLAVRGPGLLVGFLTNILGLCMVVWWLSTDIVMRGNESAGVEVLLGC